MFRFFLRASWRARSPAPNSSRAFVASASRFRRDARGNVAVMFVLAALPVMFVVGAAVDYNRTGPATANLQAALDSALLAGVMANGTQVATAQKQFAAAVATEPFQNASASFTLNADKTLSGAASAAVKTSVMAIANYSTMPINAAGAAQPGQPRQTPSVVSFTLTGAYGWYWKEVDLYVRHPGDESDTLEASYTYQPTDTSGEDGRGTGTTSAQFNVNGVMTPNAISTPVTLGDSYNKVYLKMTVYSDGCGPKMAAPVPLGSNETNFTCVQADVPIETGVNRRDRPRYATYEKTAGPAYYSTDDPSTAHNLFIGDPEIDLPDDAKPDIFALIPCGATVQHSWEDTPWGDPRPGSWSTQDIFFNVSATSCQTNANYPATSGVPRLIR